MNHDLIVQGTGYLAVKGFQAGNGLLDELEGLSTSYDKVKIPSGGGTMFEIVDENGEPEAVKEIEGVILHHHAVNGYYRERYSGNNTLPTCGSYDGKTGEGDPGGDCTTCPYNQFGSGETGTGKRCKNRRRLFILREGEMLPILLSIPTGSIREFTGFIRRLVTKGRRSFTQVVRITLRKAVNSTGIQYSQAAFAIKRSLTEEEVQAIMPLVEHIREFSRQIGLHIDTDTQPELEVDEETGEILPLK